MFAAATLAGVPVVLVTAHGEPRAGYTYDDRTGISYEYPDGRYEAWITTGDRFVYHTPDFGYTGAGVIGEIRSSATAGRLVCDILDHEPWEPPVPRMPTASTSRRLTRVAARIQLKRAVGGVRGRQAGRRP